MVKIEACLFYINENHLENLKNREKIKQFYTNKYCHVLHKKCSKFGKKNADTSGVLKEVKWGCKTFKVRSLKEYLLSRV